MTVDSARLAAILGETPISEDDHAEKIDETIREVQRSGGNITREQAVEIVLGPLRRAREERRGNERADAWAQQVAESLPRSSGRLNDRTGRLVTEIYASKPDDVPILKAMEALNKLITHGQVVMRGTCDLAVLARKGGA